MRRFVRWSRAALVVLVAGCAPKASARLPSPAAEAPTDALRRAVADVEAATGVDVRVYGLPGDGSPPRVGRAWEEPVDLALLPRALPAVERVLRAYPDAVRRRVLPEVWIVGRLRARGKPFLGLARAGRLHLAVRPRTRPLALEGTMHHEIAHLLSGEPGFDGATWRAFSAGRYVGREPRAAWRKGERGWLEAGFVAPYGSKNAGEDFATYVELGFTRPDRLRELAAGHARIAEKLAFVTAAYERLAPGVALPWVEPDDRAPWRQRR